MNQSRSTIRYATYRDKIWTRCFEPTRQDRRLLRAVNKSCDALDSCTDESLGQKMHELRSEGIELDSPDNAKLVLALALTKQSLNRTVGMIAYDVQILAGIAMSRGAIAEMQTGEGKTLTSAFPIVTHAVSGKGVHVATVNSYLAERDFEFLEPALKLLGFSVGMSEDGASTDEKRAAYDCDVTFATGYELGFDFLRDQISLMSRGKEKLGAKLRRELFSTTAAKSVECQRSHAMAIIDEIDSVLIDEAITPLVLSSGGLAKQTDVSVYFSAMKVADHLELDLDFVIDPKTKALFLTESGSRKAHGPAESQNLDTQECNGSQDNIRRQFDMLSDLDRVHDLAENRIQSTSLLRPWRQYIESALRAKHLMIRDINYVVRQDKVEIVDEYTGRIFADRNWRDGLHQAVEAKEGLPITEEKRTLARISRQRYFQRYDMLCGMTGTASGHEREMLSCYELPIVAIPLRKKSQRKELPTRYFSKEQAKIQAIASEVKERSSIGQPVLIGTRTIAQSLRLSEEFSQAGIQHQILNGVQDADEAELISVAGCAGNVTVATNMAGRGTDIQLNERAFTFGGLHVIGFERNLSARIDRQLLGRSGRQGDPGSGQFFISADDEIIKRYDTSLAKTLGALKETTNGEPNHAFDQRIKKIQEIAEAESHQSRCDVMREEMWMDKVKQAVG